MSQYRRCFGRLGPAFKRSKQNKCQTQRSCMCFYHHQGIFPEERMRPRYTREARKRRAFGGTKFDELVLNADCGLRRMFFKLFDLPDPSLLEVGCSWDISSGIIDHLGPMTLNLYRPLWIDPNDDTNPEQFCPFGTSEVKVKSILSDPGQNHPPVLNTLRTVLSLLEGMGPHTRVSYKVSRGLPQFVRFEHRDECITLCNYGRSRSQSGLQDKRNAPTIQFDR